MKRIIVVAAISGIISSIITALLFFFVFPSAWLFFIIPAVMGTSIHKLGKIPAEEVEIDEDENLQKKVGFLCAGAVLFFIILTVIPIVIVSINQGLGWNLLLNIPFFAACIIAVWYGYNRGVRAVVDSYYDYIMKDSND